MRASRPLTHQQPPEALDVAQGQRDVQEHDGVADDDGADVAVALAVDLVLDAPLAAEGHRQVGVVVALHEPDEPGGRASVSVTLLVMKMMMMMSGERSLTLAPRPEPCPAGPARSGSC